MKFKLIVFLFFVISCSPHYTKLDNRKPYSSKGFAYIYNDADYDSKLIKSKLNNDKLQISHKDLMTGSLIKIINPNTKKSLVLKNFKKIKYPDFYKVMITESVAIKLNINDQLPIVEILEIKKNKSFIAEKAKIYQEEKKISSKAPVTSVQISNISQKKLRTKEIKKDNIYILIASFYTDEAANLLKKRIINEAPLYDYKKLSIKKKIVKNLKFYLVLISLLFY